MDKTTDVVWAGFPDETLPHTSSVRSNMKGSYTLALLPSACLIAAAFMDGRSFKRKVFGNYMQAGLINWPVTPIVPPQPAHALQQHVCGSQLGKQRIGIQINALFHNLRGNQDAGRAGAGRPCPNAASILFRAPRA